uniref:Putative ovule protein n=1 Tax=Solanum chacoense TaxID=4108 RepID=A0A0V0H2Y0_SOLCH
MTYPIYNCFQLFLIFVGVFGMEENIFLFSIFGWTNFLENKFLKNEENCFLNRSRKITSFRQG